MRLEAQPNFATNQFAPSTLPQWLVWSGEIMARESSTNRKLTGMLSLIAGDIFQSTAQTLTIAVNTQGVMGKGQALQAKRLFPDVFEEYRVLCAKKMLRVGEPALVNAKSGRLFLLFPTKAHWRENSKLAYIEDGLRFLAENYGVWGIKSLALPALGCGLGNLDWKDVGPILCGAIHALDLTRAEIYLPLENDIDEQYLLPDYLLSSPAS
jgi:O-acetyl-ADP-ribose deacetylase (regulator of RNase III)